MTEKKPTHKTGLLARRPAQLSLAVCVLTIVAMLVRLHIYVDTLLRRTDRLEGATADARALVSRTERLEEEAGEAGKSAHLAARAADDLGREWMRRRRPEGLLKERRFQREIHEPKSAFDIKLQPSERPVYGSLEIINQGARPLRGVRVRVNGRGYFRKTADIVRFTVPDEAAAQDEVRSLIEHLGRQPG